MVRSGNEAARASLHRGRELWLFPEAEELLVRRSGQGHACARGVGGVWGGHHRPGGAADSQAVGLFQDPVVWRRRPGNGDRAAADRQANPRLHCRHGGRIGCLGPLGSRFVEQVVFDGHRIGADGGEREAVMVGVVIGDGHADLRFGRDLVQFCAAVAGEQLVEVVAVVVGGNADTEVVGVAADVNPGAVVAERIPELAP